VDIQIYDENAKLPLLWTIKSIYPKNRNRFDKSLIDQLTELLGTPSSISQQATSLIRNISGPLDISDLTVTLRKGRVRNRSRQSKQKTRLGWKPTSSRVRRKQRLVLDKKRREALDVFGAQWHQMLRSDSEFKTLLPDPAEVSPVFVDYLGAWGHDKININTAPPEVLQAAFHPIGMDSKMVRAIVNYRQKNPIASSSIMRDISEISSIQTALRYFATVRSDTFTVKVKASLGKAQHNLFAVVSLRNTGQLQTNYITTGD